MHGRITFTGSFWIYFLACLGLALCTILTLGLLAPYAVWWQARYFFDHMELVVTDQWDGQKWVSMLPPAAPTPPDPGAATLGQRRW